MAPPTGPRANTNLARRGTTRGRGGGISKNRLAPIRKDRDGDVSMDAPAAGDAARGGRGGAAPPTRGVRPNRGSSRGPSQGTTRATSRLQQKVKNYLGVDDDNRDSRSRFNRATFKIYGLKNSLAMTNDDGGLAALVSFIERKNQMKVVRSLKDGDCVWVTVHKDDASGVLRLNGYDFAGTTITVTETTDRMPAGQDGISAEAAETKSKLMTVLGQRYFPESKLLNLSALGADAILSSMGTFGSTTLAEKAFRVLMQLASQQYKNNAERKEALQSVSLASNEINDVKQVYTLANSLPDLKRLDLSNNRIDSFAGLSKWKGHFRHLQELHLTGNPITELPDFLPELLQWFPALQLLNGQQVRTPEQAAESLASLLPKPLPQFPSNLRDGDNNVAPAFLQALFPMYDNNRDGLLSAFYDEESWFSLTAMPDSGRNLPWKTYMKYSRNIHQPRGKPAPMAHRLFIGGGAISDLWKALPATRHPPLDPSTGWVVDCHVFDHLPDPSNNLGFAAGLFINARGMYEESDPANNLFGVRTFSRTFVLGPSKPGAPHPYRVVSDQLTLLQWTPAADTAASTMQTVPTAVVPVPTPAVPVAVPVLDDATKNQLIQEVSNRTGMTLEYSRMCLDTFNANWNIDLALASFAQLKDTLPAEAFLFRG